ncbi:hypothetical protein C8R47DRAFT_1148638 [Mycena vitilis]|nr:hypothetical protein C8R47DRAFT_1148638 [Mycena vitilis]
MLRSPRDACLLLLAPALADGERRASRQDSREGNLEDVSERGGAQRQCGAGFCHWITSPARRMLVEYWKDGGSSVRYTESPIEDA